MTRHRPIGIAILAILSTIAAIQTGLILIYCLTPGVKRAFGEPAMRAA
jgi:hypothetical protein